MSTQPHTAHDADSSSMQMTALRWISVLVSALIVVQALLAGQGIWGGDRDLITGHEMLGNGIFLLVAIQVVLSFLAYQKGQIGRNHLILNGIIMLLLFAQIGLGYSGRETSGAIAWHLPNGVLLMGASTINAVLFWMRSSVNGGRLTP
jgi:hypothetical protein